MDSRHGDFYLDGLAFFFQKQRRCQNSFRQQAVFVGPTVAIGSPTIRADPTMLGIRIVNMTDAEIEAWVDSTVKAGIRKVRTQFGKYAWSIGKMDKLMAFYKAFDKYRVE